MALYWLLAKSSMGLMPTVAALTDTKLPHLAMGGFAFLLVMIVGFRHEVGADWIHTLSRSGSVYLNNFLIYK